jgi:FkbM family methyltransferase
LIFVDFRRFVTSRLRADQAFTRAAFKAYGHLHGTAVHFSEGLIDIRRGNDDIRIAANKLPYARDMIVHFETYHGTVCADGNGLVDYSEPRVHRYRKRGLEFHLPSIPEEEEVIESYFRWYSPKLGDFVFDIGAYAGVSTYFLSKAVGPTGRVLALEPDPIAWRSLLRNLEYHNMQNVIPIQKAMAGTSARVGFQAEGAVGSALASIASRPSAGDTILVDTITFAQACEIAGALPAFVKMDIEGAELEVIESASDLLKRSSVHFSVDTNHFVDGRLTNHRLEKLFSYIGFEAYSSSDNGFMTTWARPAAKDVLTLIH